MTVRKLTTGEWIADFYSEDRSDGKKGKRVRKKFATKGEALAYERYELDKLNGKPWVESNTKDTRRLRDLIDIWYKAHGVTLGDGARRHTTMLWASECMGDPLATEFTAQLFSKYREQRLSGKLSRTKRVETVAPRTVNLELSYFLAVFNELKRLGEWEGDNPLENVRAFRTDESEMAFLTHEQIADLFKACEESSAKDLSLVVKIALSTGARWAEAETLQRSQITPNKITFIKTKGKRNRTVPISQDLYDEIYTKSSKKGKLFTPCYYAFRSAINRAKIELPDGQLSHVLRHTFASHFMMNGGNILVLQRILGHTDIKMTMRYSHFAPEHLDDAVKLNPLSRMVI
ncbi:tyrosine-type recombinase/integrase [Xenorhabdus sp. XENO-10]|uniref:Tyrosine-type recombinase/integrase n=1 Tax=Xenorhabdus yunnanensis TaxID=3025878 RepID=A0ABT5LJD3_9GAMM|nr:tyrosine-type recombinase/integrase [Xenorhabdus yunnanensis]MDC9591216.1 tyrosine-type recombinase/integrase [Xenorhabdus yunnanensis]